MSKYQVICLTTNPPKYRVTGGGVAFEFGHLKDQAEHVCEHLNRLHEDWARLDKRIEILGTTQNGASAVRLDGVVYHAISGRLAEMIDAQRKALDGTSYMAGLMNGLLTVESVVLGTQPKFVETKPRKTDPSKLARLEGERLHLEAEVKNLRACLQEIADTCISASSRARDKVKEIQEILGQYTRPVKHCLPENRGESLLGDVTRAEINPFVDTITERELAFAINCRGIDAAYGTTDFEMARQIFQKILENRGKHPSLMQNSGFCEDEGFPHSHTDHVCIDSSRFQDDDAETGGGDGKANAAAIFASGDSDRILAYLQRVICTSVIDCALVCGAQPVPPQELRLWSEYDLREVIRDELTANGLPVTHS